MPIDVALTWKEEAGASKAQGYQDQSQLKEEGIHVDSQFLSPLW